MTNSSSSGKPIWRNDAETYIASASSQHKKRHSFLCDETGFIFYGPDDLRGLSKETLLRVKGSLEAESVKLATQIKQITALHNQEINRLSSKRFFVTGLAEEARQEVSKATKAEKQERHRTHETLFLEAAKALLSPEEYRRIQDAVYAEIRQKNAN